MRDDPRAIDDSTLLDPALDPGAALEMRLARESVRASLFPGMAPRPRIGRYEIRSRLGSGGMGLVMAAYDPHLDREVAIKLLRSDGEDTEEGHARLRREARVIARLRHPNVVTVHDAGVHEGRLYVVMELVRGRSLRDWIAKARPWPAIVALLLQAGRGLAAAHEAGLVHRDVKPANVLVDRGGSVKVVDFGLARPPTAGEPGAPHDVGLLITQTGAIVGTPAYMAPEHLLGGTVDERSDQFAYGVTFYEALFRRRPVDGATFAELRHRLLTEPIRFPPATGVPRPVLDVLARSLARQPEDRFPTMSALLAALEDALHRAESSPVEVALSQTGSELAAEPAAHPLDAYLEGLPHGVDSYPACRYSGYLLRLALARGRGQPPLDARVTPYVESLSPERGWIRTVHARLILTDLFHRRFPELGAWRRFMESNYEAGLKQGFLGFLIPPARSPLLLRSFARVYQSAHPGVTASVEEEAEGTGVVGLTFPAGLYDEQACTEAVAAFLVLLGHAGAHYREVRCVEAAATMARLQIRWHRGA
ncbi:MAG: serine/threonine-protein kinase [Sandaracinaceae bacterium]